MLLARVSKGDAAAVESLLPFVYSELRSRAGAYFRGQRADHTLQPTALVHEAYLRLVHTPVESWKSRAHFCAVASMAMRQILIAHARSKAASERAHEKAAAMRTQIETPSQSTPIDLLALEDALTKLAGVDESKARLVELRYFGGLSNKDIAEVLGVSERTVEREWRRVRAWLLDELEQS